MSEVMNAVEAATEVANVSKSTGAGKYNKFGWGLIAGIGTTLLIEGGVMGVCKLIDGGKKKKKKTDEAEEKPTRRKKRTAKKATKKKTEPVDEEEEIDDDLEDEDEE